MRVSRQQTAPNRVDARGAALAACMLGACIGVGCGDAAGHPIRSRQPDAAALLGDAGQLDAMSSATLLDPGLLPPMDLPGGANQGYDGHPNDEIPHIAYCFDAANWPEDSRDDEQQMQEAINQWREGRVRCPGDRESSQQLPPLRFPPALRCSARVHSFDMAERHYFDTRGSDGSQPGQRMTLAGFAHGASDESIAVASSDAIQVLFDLLDNSEACANLASREFTALGVGEYGGVWTFDFAADP